MRYIFLYQRQLKDGTYKTDAIDLVAAFATCNHEVRRNGQK